MNTFLAKQNIIMLELCSEIHDIVFVVDFD